MGCFRAWLKKHSGLYCILKLIRQFKNYDFRDYLLSYYIGMQWREFVLPEVADPNAMHLSIYQRGKLNPDKVIYQIPLDTAGFGFCSQMLVILNRINFAVELGMTPCVNWYASSLYKEKEPIRGTTNIFEYYFEPIEGISVEKAEKSRFVVYDDLARGYGTGWVYLPLTGKAYSYTEDDLSRFAYLMKNYICLQKSVKKKLYKQINSLLKGKKVLGVHGRGGDMKLSFQGHPLCVSGLEYAVAAERAMKEIDAELVFLATDDLEILDTFKTRFQNKLVYFQDVVRSPGRIHNAMIQVDRSQHHYKLGFEILRDVYTLAHCQGLITGLSTVNGMARVVKKSMDAEYEYQEIIDRGTHQKGINVNDPNFLKNDAPIVQKIFEIQQREDISKEEQLQLIEGIMDRVYGEEEMPAYEGTSDEQTIRI